MLVGRVAEVILYQTHVRAYPDEDVQAQAIGLHVREGEVVDAHRRFHVQRAERHREALVHAVRCAAQGAEAHLRAQVEPAAQRVLIGQRQSAQQVVGLEALLERAARVVHVAVVVVRAQSDSHSAGHEEVTASVTPEGVGMTSPHQSAVVTRLGRAPQGHAQQHHQQQPRKDPRSSSYVAFTIQRRKGTAFF